MLTSAHSFRADLGAATEENATDPYWITSFFRLSQAQRCRKCDAQVNILMASFSKWSEAVSGHWAASCDIEETKFYWGIVQW